MNGEFHTIRKHLARIEAKLAPKSSQPAMQLPTCYIPDGDSEQNRQAEAVARLAHVGVKYLGVGSSENGCEP